jgi:hypothetical protein
MRRSVALVSAFALLLLSAAAGSLGLAEIYRRDAMLIIDAWDPTGAGGAPDPAWRRVERFLLLAGRLAPFDAQIQRDLGELYEARSVAPADPATTAGPIVTAGSPVDARYRSALAHYRRAVALRPAAATGWTDIALLKVSRQDIDAEFAQAFRHALALGRWESVVQASLAGGGLSVWRQLPADLQLAVEDAVLRGIARNSRLMRLVVRRFALAETGDTAAP